jgi:hypothetical protein
MHEYRVLSFREKEVTEALTQFRKKSDFEPLGFHSLEVSQRDSDVVVQCHDKERDVPHRYSDHEVCSALMLYCMREKIPLPRRGSKSVYIAADGIKLVIEVGHQ